MEVLPTILLLLLVAVLAVLVWLVILLKTRTPVDQFSRVDAAFQTLKAELIAKQMEGLVSLRESLDSANRLLNERLAEGTDALDRRLELFSEIEKKLAQLEMQAKAIQEVGQNIQSLSELLKPPRLRGSLGELLLQNLLSQILPGRLYMTQHRFPDGHRVDAVVKLGERLLPIDSKFPLEAFQQVLSGEDADQARRSFIRSLKQHVDSINTKYIRPEHKTTEFAVMYIPSEAVYYEFVSRPDGEALEYALTKKVIPSSPGHLYAFLASISAVYAGSGLVDGLSTESARLAAGLNTLSENLSRLAQLHERMDGSVRSLTLSLAKARDVSTDMSVQLGRLREPAAPPVLSAEPGDD